jgi:peroxiredoxin Q/BCP
MRYKLGSIVGLGLVWLCTLNGNEAQAADASVKAGMEAPAFTLPSQEDLPVSLSDFKGRWVVVYFYPKDKSSGCTLEAHTYQGDLPKFEAKNAVILGVSLDTTASHKSFCTQDGLTFKLLSDPERKVASAYGVPELNFHGVKFDERDTILITPDGKIAQVWRNVDPRGDSANVLAEIARLQGR